MRILRKRFAKKFTPSIFSSSFPSPFSRLPPLPHSFFKREKIESWKLKKKKIHLLPGIWFFFFFCVKWNWLSWNSQIQIYILLLFFFSKKGNWKWSEVKLLLLLFYFLFSVKICVINECEKFQGKGILLRNIILKFYLKKVLTYSFSREWGRGREREREGGGGIRNRSKGENLRGIENVESPHKPKQEPACWR